MDQLNSFHACCDSVQESMRQGLGELAEYLGFNRTLGEIYGVLLFQPDPLCLEEIAAQVDKSKASVSHYTRTLEQLRTIRRVCRSDLDNRRKYYEAETDLQRVAADLTRRKLHKLERIQAVIEASRAQMAQFQASDADPTDETVLLMERVSLLYDCVDLLHSMIASITASLSDHPEQADSL